MQVQVLIICNTRAKECWGVGLEARENVVHCYVVEVTDDDNYTELDESLTKILKRGICNKIQI